MDAALKRQTSSKKDMRDEVSLAQARFEEAQSEVEAKMDTVLQSEDTHSQ